MWNVKAEVIPLIIWVAGTISKSFRKYLGNIPEKAPIQGTTKKKKKKKKK
jgi:hypothetical protein